MSSYGTEFELTDADGDELYINRSTNGIWPLMVHMRREGVELYREDVERLHAYLGSIVDEVPARPTPPPVDARIESIGAIRDGIHVWSLTRLVCHNTLNINTNGRNP